MYYKYVDIANVAQKLPINEKEKIYNIYKTMLPKKKMFLKYVKKQTEEICRLAILDNKPYNYQYLEPKFKEIFSYL